jgi:glycolate oxidase
MTMALKREAYRALEDILGRENISEDPAEMHAYSLHFGRAVFGVSLFFPLPEAVVLPASTEEVQAIVKTCNRYRVRFKALSTGWGAINSPGGKGAILLDMRRMNRILEINERSMFAVVEPYVISARLQAELMKRGLNFNIVGAGSNTTALAPIKHTGYGNTGESTGVESRNILGFEWVLPTGDIVRTGSLSSGAGWFYSEGPGPSLRGLVRGANSAFGGIGVITKAALKIYHWAGPPVPEIEGRETEYAMKITPDMLMKLWYTHFPSADKMREALYKLSESKICFVCMRFGDIDLAAGLGTSNQDTVEFFEKLKKEVVVGGFIVIISANSPKEFAYKEKVLRQILAETEGKTLSLVEEPRYQGILMWHVVRATHAPRGGFRATGSFATSFGTMETIDLAVNQMKVGTDLKKQYIEKGQILSNVEDFNWGNAYEGGHLCHMEEMILFHPNPEGLAGSRGFSIDTREAALDPELKFRCSGLPLMVSGDADHDVFGPASSNYHLWLRKIKEAFDPNGVAEANFYITPNGRYKEGSFKPKESEG